MDPTLLLAPSDFPVGKRKHNYKYVCRFLLDETPIKRDFIRKFSNHLNLKEVNNYLNLDFSFPIIRKVVNNKGLFFYADYQNEVSDIARNANGYIFHELTMD